MGAKLNTAVGEWLKESVAEARETGTVQSMHIDDLYRPFRDRRKWADGAIQVFECAREMHKGTDVSLCMAFAMNDELGSV
jgi:hypothetical protein